MLFITSTGHYLTAENGGGLNGDPDRGPARADALIANRTRADLDQYGDSWQQFTVVHNDDGTVALRIGSWYVTAERGGGSYVSTDRTVNEAWQRFTEIRLANDAVAFRCVDGRHFLRVLSSMIVDASGTADMDEAIAFLPDRPPQPDAGVMALYADRVTLRNPSGDRVSLCGYDQFTALRMTMDHVDLQPFLDESKALGFHLWRVFGQAAQSENGYYDLRPTEPGYYDALDRLAARLMDHGIYLLFTCYADNQVIKSGLEHWTRCADVLSRYQEAVFLSGGNEWQKNGFDPASLPAPNLKWWSRGSSLGDEAPPTPNGATFVEFHPRRDYPKALDDTVASATYIEHTFGFTQPLIIDEPPRMGEDGSGDVYADPAIVWQFARHYSSQCAGAVFHARPGQKGALIDPNSRTMQCALAWVDAWQGVVTP